jgi:drug/metabolite transporter (DMT)-like permease
MDSPAPRPPAALAPWPFAALLLGVAAIGASGLFVRLIGLGPFISAFGRALLALPALYLWARWESRGAPLGRIDRALFLAGLFFAGDLFFWHLALLNTSIANATLLATIAPVWVILALAFLFGERPDRATWTGLALCCLGAALLIGGNARINPGQFLGDLSGVITSFFFAGYFLAVREAGRRSPPGRIGFFSTCVTAAALLPIALLLDGPALPASPGAWAALVALALLSHAGGLGMVTYGLAHLPAAFSSLVIFLETVSAAALAWIFLGEAVSVLQAAGGLLILAGIVTARPRERVVA